VGATAGEVSGESVRATPHGAPIRAAVVLEVAAADVQPGVDHQAALERIPAAEREALLVTEQPRPERVALVGAVGLEIRHAEDQPKLMTLPTEGAAGGDGRLGHSG
jgi:hypothetical protein